MKEISEIPETPITTETYSKVRPISKRWKTVKKNSHPNRFKATLDTSIIKYELVLGKVKELYLDSGERCYERNFKDDNENPFTIYSFLTSTFYWNIECDYTYNINIDYQFYHCPYEDEIRELFMRFNLTLAITEVSKLPTLAAHYKAVLAYQKPQFIHTL
jgi:hypothetical protein